MPANKHSERPSGPLKMRLSLTRNAPLVFLENMLFLIMAKKCKEEIKKAADVVTVKNQDKDDKKKVTREFID